jgi:hypothetical protein
MCLAICAFCLKARILKRRMREHFVHMSMKTKKSCRLLRWSVTAACAVWLAGGQFAESYAQTPPAPSPATNPPPSKFKE